jgi:hypothetical protein
VTQGGARSSLALGYYHIVPTGLQFGSLHSHSWPTPLLNGAPTRTHSLKHKANRRVHLSSNVWPTRTLSANASPEETLLGEGAPEGVGAANHVP